MSTGLAIGAPIATAAASRWPAHACNFVRMILVWYTDLGSAVTGVTRRRDGFRNSSDGRSKPVVAVCHRMHGRWKPPRRNCAVQPAVSMSFSTVHVLDGAIQLYGGLVSRPWLG